MTTPVNDTDRIIAAHRDEARRTRTLLLWLLLGIPAIAGVVLVIAFAVSSGSASQDTTTVPDNTTFAVPTPAPPAASSLTLASHCSDLLAQPDVTPALAAIIGPQSVAKNAALGNDLNTECAINERTGDETLGVALVKARAAYTAGD